MGIFVKTSVALAAALSLTATPGALAATSSSGAYGARLNLNANVQVPGFGADTAVLARTPDVQASGSSSYGPLEQTVLGAQASLFSTTVFSAGVLFGRTEYVSTEPRTFSRGAAENVDVNLQVTPLLPLVGLDADSIEATARITGVCGQLAAVGHTELVGARVGALGGGLLNLPVHPSPNFTVDLGVLGIAGVTLILNEQVQSGNGFSRSISVNALHLDVSANALLASLAGDIVIGHAEASLSCAAGDGPDLRGSKSMSPNPGTVGQPVQFALAVTNVGNQTAQNVTLTDTLHPSFNFQSATAGPGGVCSRNGQLVSCTFASLSPGQSGTAQIVIIPTVAGNFSNRADVIYDGPIPPPESPEIPVVIVNPTLVADFALGLSAAPSPATAGLPLSYTLTVTNTGPDAAGASLSNLLPAGVTLESASASDGGSCSAGNPVNCTWSSIPNGAVRTVTIVVVPTQTGTLTNTATVSAGPGAVDPDPSDNSATVDTLVNPAPIVADLSISKSASPSPATLGQPLTYTLSVSNAGPDAAAATVSDTLPAGVDLVSANASEGGNCSGQSTVTCSWSNIPSGASRTATLVVNPTATGSLVNTAAVVTGGGAGDPNPSDNSSTVTTQVNPAPIVADFSVLKTASPSPATVGQPLTYTITVSNSGPDTASASISDALPGAVQFSAASASDGGVCSGTATVICSWTGIPSGASRTASIVVVPTLAGPLSNTVAVGHTGGGSDPDPSDDSSTVVVNVSPAAIVADFSIVKTASPNPGTVGQPLTYTLTVTNHGPDTAGASVSDLLSAAAVYSTASASDGGSCAGTSNVICNWNAIPAGGVRSATIVVVPSQPGPLGNSATVTPTGGAGDPDPGDDTSTISTPINPTPIVADFAVVKTANPDPATVGQPLTYTLTVTNSGPDAASASVTDTLPGTVSLTSTAASNGGACAGGATVVCSWSAIPAGAVRTATLVVIPNQPGTLRNSAAVAHTGGGSDPDAGDDVSTIDTPVNPASAEADLGVAMTASPNPGIVGQALTYTITVGNAGPSASGASVSDVLPAGTNLVSATASEGGVCSSSTTLICTWGSIPVGAQRSIILVLTPTQAGTLSNTAIVSPTGGTADPDPSDNSVTVQTPVNAAQTTADLGVQISASPNPVTVGSNLVYTLTVSNAGPDPTSARLSDALPATFTLVSAIASDGGSCTGGVPVNCTWPSIAPGGSRTASLSVRPTATGAISNTATVASTDGSVDPDPANNSASTVVQVNPNTLPPRADLGVTLAASPQPATVGLPLLLTVRIDNAGPDASGASLTHTLPASFAIQAVSASAGGICSGAPNLACSWPSVVAGGNVEVLVSVLPASAGNFQQSAIVSTASGIEDPVPGNNSAVQTVQVNTAVTVPVANLRTVVRALPEFASLGDTVVLEVEVFNNGPDAAAIVLNQTLAAGFTLIDVQPGSGATCTQLNCSFPATPAGNSVRMNLRVTPNRTGTVVHLASATALAPATDPDLSDNTGSAAVNVAAPDTPQRADLMVEKVAFPADPVVGSTVDYLLTVRNLGPDNAAGPIVLTDDLPASLRLLSVATVDGGSCAIDGNRVRCTFNGLANGKSATASLLVLATAVGVQRNQLLVTHPNQDPDPGNDSTFRDVDVRPDSLAGDGSECRVTRRLTTHADNTFSAIAELRYGGAEAVYADLPNGLSTVYRQSLKLAVPKALVAGDGSAMPAQLVGVSRNGGLSLVRSSQNLASRSAEPLASAASFLVDVRNPQARRLPAELDAAILPALDGSGGQLVYLLAEGGQVRLKAYDSSSGDSRVVASFAGEPAQFGALRVSNHGGQVALTARINPVGENADGSMEVFRIDLARGTVRQVTAGVNASYQLGGFDGAGRRLTWIGEGQVQVHDPVTGSRTLTRDGDAKTTALLTQNGQRVVYLSQSGAVPGSFELVSVGVDDNAAPVVLTRLNQAANGGQDRLLSHDGAAQTFLLASRRPLLADQQAGVEHVYVVDCDAIRNGAWYNPERSGYGFAIQRSSDGLAVLWYTYDIAGNPVWYIASGPRRGKSWQADLLDVRYNAADGSRALTTIGTLALSFADAHHAVAQWTINGSTRFEPIQFLEFAANAPPRDDTGIYFDPANPGWGLSVSEQGGIRFLLAYLYDQEGRPVWVEGQTDQESRSSTPARVYRGPGLCPVGCNETAPTPISTVIGQWQVDPYALGEVDISTSFIDNAVLRPIRWVRAATAFRPLVPLSP